MSEQAYTSIHYFTTRHTHSDDMSLGERIAIAWREFKDDVTRTYQALLDNSADMVIRKFDL